MGTIPASLAEKLASLGKDFTEKLKSRVTELQTEERRLRELPQDREVLQQLRLHVHSLAGAGATFGYTKISTRARELETVLDRTLKGQLPITDHLLLQIDRRIEELAELANVSSPERQMDVFTEKPGSTKRTSSKKNLFLYESDDEVVKDLSHQLGYFGYTVHRIERLGQLAETVEEAERHLAIVNAAVLEEDRNAQAFLADLKRRYPDTLSLVFTSEKDDFETRLLAVRAGGDAYLLKPYDIGALIDRLESMAVQSENVPYHILIVDDDPEQVAYYALVLQQAGMITSVALDPKRVISVLHEAKPELILMDMYMPGCNGMELSSIIRQYQAFVSIPIVFLSVETDLDRQLAAVRLGGDDFLTKPIKPEHLVLSVTTRAARTRSIRYFMERDSLTGLLNHTNLKENLTREVLRAQRLETPMSFVMIDVDHFKSVNDTYGHLTGDGVLKSLARLLQERLRRTDIIGRYGGEEFGVILLNVSADVAAVIMNEIRENFSRIRQQATGEEFFVTFSCGIASFPEVKDAAALNVAADYALYEAKETGRNRAVIATSYPEA